MAFLLTSAWRTEFPWSEDAPWRETTLVFSDLSGSWQQVAELPIIIGFHDANDNPIAPPAIPFKPNGSHIALSVCNLYDDGFFIEEQFNEVQVYTPIDWGAPPVTLLSGNMDLFRVTFPPERLWSVIGSTNQPYKNLLAIGLFNRDTDEYETRIYDASDSDANNWALIETIADHIYPSFSPGGDWLVYPNENKLRIYRTSDWEFTDVCDLGEGWNYHNAISFSPMFTRAIATVYTSDNGNDIAEQVLIDTAQWRIISRRSVSLLSGPSHFINNGSMYAAKEDAALLPYDMIVRCLSNPGYKGRLRAPFSLPSLTERMYAYPGKTTGKYVATYWDMYRP
jgi:hypothetical protein